MIFKRFKPFTAPVRFEFKDPTTGREFKGRSIRDLISQISSYREQNELEPIEFIQQVIENYLCSLKGHEGACEPLKNPKRSVVQYIQGGIALLKNIAFKDFVSQEEADRRAEICTRCPKNIFPDKEFFIKWSDDMAQLSVGDRKAVYHDKLGTCEACSCNLKGKVWYKGKIKLTPEQLEEIEALDDPKCWQPEFTK